MKKMISLEDKKTIFLQSSLISFLLKHGTVPVNSVGYALLVHQKEDLCTIELDYECETFVSLMGEGWENTSLEIGSKFFFNKEGRLVSIGLP